MQAATFGSEFDKAVEKMSSCTCKKTKNENASVLKRKTASPASVSQLSGYKTLEVGDNSLFSFELSLKRLRGIDKVIRLLKSALSPTLIRGHIGLK